jgi:hypothetical protein
VPGATWRENNRKMATHHTTAGDDCQATSERNPTGAMCLGPWGKDLRVRGRGPRGLVACSWTKSSSLPRAFPCIFNSSSWHSKVYVQGICLESVCRKNGGFLSTVAWQSPSSGCFFSLQIRAAAPINTSVAWHALHSTKLLRLCRLDLGES